MSERLRSPRVVSGLLLSLLVFANTAWLLNWARHMHGLTIIDENFSVVGARWLHDDGSRLFGAIAFDDRGVERLLQALFLPAIWVTKDTARQFAINHVLVAVLFALQSVVAYLIARDLGARRPWAFAA